MINTLQFNLSLPTPYVFMRRFLKAAESEKKVCRFLAVHMQTEHTTFEDGEFLKSCFIL